MNSSLNHNSGIRFADQENNNLLYRSDARAKIKKNTFFFSGAILNFGVKDLTSEGWHGDR